MLTLNELKSGESATVLKINTNGILHRRFTDIGITKGAKIKCLFKSPQGDPKAFLIRGTVIALRDDDSALIEVGDKYE